MEKSGDHRSKNSGFLRFLAKSTSFSIPRHHLYNPPARERSYFNKAFSGPIVSLIPAEARRQKESATVDGDEPLSPKVSCMGQIKGKKRSSKPKRRPPSSSSVQEQQQQQQQKKKTKQQQQQACNFSFRAGKAGESVRDGGGAPWIGEMRRFASGRETITDFDWKKGESSAYDHEVIIAYSAPLMVGGSDRTVAAPEPEPRKEVNIWKRRTMAPPRPLQL